MSHTAAGQITGYVTTRVKRRPKIKDKLQASKDPQVQPEEEDREPVGARRAHPTIKDKPQLSKDPQAQVKKGDTTGARKARAIKRIQDDLNFDLLQVFDPWNLSSSLAKELGLNALNVIEALLRVFVLQGLNRRQIRERFALAIESGHRPTYGPLRQLYDKVRITPIQQLEQQLQQRKQRQAVGKDGVQEKELLAEPESEGPTEEELAGLSEEESEAHRKQVLEDDTEEEASEASDHESGPEDLEQPEDSDKESSIELGRGARKDLSDIGGSGFGEDSLDPDFSHSQLLHDESTLPPDGPNILLADDECSFLPDAASDLPRDKNIPPLSDHESRRPAENRGLEESLQPDEDISMTFSDITQTHMPNMAVQRNAPRGTSIQVTVPAPQPIVPQPTVSRPTAEDKTRVSLEAALVDAKTKHYDYRKVFEDHLRLYERICEAEDQYKKRVCGGSQARISAQDFRDLTPEALTKQAKESSVLQQKLAKYKKSFARVTTVREQRQKLLIRAKERVGGAERVIKSIEAALEQVPASSEADVEYENCDEEINGLIGELEEDND
jgi:hypothetical protein